MQILKKCSWSFFLQGEFIQILMERFRYTLRFGVWGTSTFKKGSSVGLWKSQKQKRFEEEIGSRKIDCPQRNNKKLQGKWDKRKTDCARGWELAEPCTSERLEVNKITPLPAVRAAKVAQNGLGFSVSSPPPPGDDHPAEVRIPGFHRPLFPPMV